VKIGILSDTHDRLPMIAAALARFGEAGVAAVLHAGDYVAPFAARMLAAPSLPQGCQVHCIYGNNDGERAGLAGKLPGIADGPLRLRLAGRTIVMIHDAVALTDDDLADADVVVAGHTHEVVNQLRDGVLQLNPGECCGWLSGRCTAAILDTDTLTAEIAEL